jgi:hypothetical protein
MKIVSFVAAVLAVSVSFTFAEEPKKLTIGECIEVYSALANLDAFDRVVKEGGTERVVKGQYRLGEARMTIALNMGALRPVIDAANKTRQQIIAEVGEGATTKPETMVKAQEMFDRAMKEPCPVSPGHIKIGDLNLGDGPDKNQIPPSVINGVMPIVDRIPPSVINGVMPIVDR